MEIFITTPVSFSFKRTVMSHGWCELLPFELDQKRWRLLRVLDAEGGQPVTVSLSPAAQGSLLLRTSRALGKRAAAGVARDVRHMLRLDEDMSAFYLATEGKAEFAWIEREGAGRLLRSPTVFEDLVKTICTTNCSWALTDKMVMGLVNSLGRESKDGRRCFPSAAVMAEMPPRFYRDEVRAGYRAPYLMELAERVASGALDVESWLHSDLPTADLKREMKGVKGVGDYAAENLLKLVGRYDGLALDSWVRAKFARTHGRGRSCSDKKIAKYYSRFESWQGLALWCDMTRDWLEEEVTV
jgi:3-methyladenine DNA glycosylase/8-oxoguanine DNA glycosylase